MGTLLDNEDLKTLENPDKHSMYCLLDIQRCYESGFELLTLPDAGSKEHVRSYSIASDGNEKIISLGRDIGSGSRCTTCKKEASDPLGKIGSKGFHATIVGETDGTVNSDNVPILNLKT